MLFASIKTLEELRDLFSVNDFTILRHLVKTLLIPSVDRLQVLVLSDFKLKSMHDKAVELN